MADPQMPVNTVSVAYRGQQVDLEKYPPLERLPAAGAVKEKYKIPTRHVDYEPDPDVDFSDLENINREIVQLRIRIHQVRNDFKKAKRTATHLKFVYEQEKKRTWIQLSGGDAKLREAVSEVMTEELYSEWLVANTVMEELNELSRVLRTELDALKELSNNQRKQIDIQ